MFDLYNHIESLGKAAGYKNMTALCAAAGVPRANMTELKMRRSNDMSKKNAQKFADLLGVSLDRIYGQEEKPVTDPDDELWDYLQLLKDRPEQKILLDHTRNATKEQIEAIIKVLGLNREE